MARRTFGLMLGASLCAGPTSPVHATPPGQSEMAPARARVALLPTRIEGEVSDVAQVRIQGALQEGLEAAGVSVVVSEAAASAPYASCADAACLEGAHAALAADYVAWLELRVDGRDYEIALRVHAQTGSQTQSETECEICGFDEVADAVRAEANAIASRLDRLDAPGVLVITSDPSGAQISVDGVAVGTTPLSHEVPAGEHILAVSKAGYATREQRIDVSQGAEERMLLSLNAVRDDARSGRTKSILGWSLVGVGAAGLGTGAALVAIHHKPASGRCDDAANVDVNGLCRWRYTTMTPGIIGLATGGAALLGGVGLLVLHARDKRAAGSTDTQARARGGRTTSLELGWGRVSLSGRF